MKLIFIPLLRKFVILSLFFVAFISCEKIDPGLVNSWSLKNSSYLFTANRDFTFHNPFEKLWEGSISIENEIYDASSFTFYFENVWGSTRFDSDDLRMTFLGPHLMINLVNSDNYMLESYELDLVNGFFKAEGMATNENGSIQVKVDVRLPKKMIRKGEQTLVRDVYHATPYLELNFHAKGTLKIDYLTGDIVERIAGKWSVKNDQITFYPEKHSNQTYYYYQKDNHLYLFKNNLSGEEIPSYLSPFADKMSNITYQVIYEKN